MTMSMMSIPTEHTQITTNSMMSMKNTRMMTTITMKTK